MAILKAFILQSKWADSERYPLQYYCSSNEGTILLKFDTEKFVFFAERLKLEQAKVSSFQSKFIQKTVPLKSFDGGDVNALYCQNSSDFFNLRKELAQAGVRTFENDIWPTDRFLMERFIYGSLQIEGEYIDDGGVKTFLNPKVTPTSYTPEFNICSLDIETGVDGSLYSIGVHYSGIKQKEHVFMLAETSKRVHDTLTYHESEKELLTSFMAHFKNMDPDLIIGWHVIGFDLKFLENKCLKLGLKLNLGRDNSEIRIDERKGAGFFAI